MLSKLIGACCTLVVILLALTLPAPQREAAAAAGLRVTRITFDEVSAKKLYNRTCAACHQESGRGVPGQIPPHSRHVPQLLAARGGRAYLPQVVLFGLRGPITVLGKHYNSQMPAWQSVLSDADVAAILNYTLTSWGNDKSLPSGFTPYTAEEIGAARQRDLSDQQVYGIRKGLDVRAETP